MSNIVTVPSNIGTEVLVFGTRTLFSQQSGAVVHVSFRQHERGCEQDDYEEWEVCSNTTHLHDDVDDVVVGCCVGAARW